MRFKKSNGRSLAMKGMRPRYNTPTSENAAENAAATTIPLHVEGHRAPEARVFHDPVREQEADKLAKSLVKQMDAGQLLQVMLILSPEPDLVSPSGHIFLREVERNSTKNVIKQYAGATYAGQDRLKEDCPSGGRAVYYHIVFVRDGIYAVEDALFQRAFRRID